MTAKKVFRQINTQALYALSELFQKDVTSLVDYYLSDSKKLMEKLKVHFSKHEFHYIMTTARELRENSVEVGATYFSFIMLGLEIVASEHRITQWQETLNLIEQNYQLISHELSQMSHKNTSYYR